MYDHWNSAELSMAVAPHVLANTEDPGEERPLNIPNISTAYRERRASSTRQRPPPTRSSFSIPYEHREHGSLSCNVSRPQTPFPRPPSPLRSIKRMKKPSCFLLPASLSLIERTPDAPGPSVALTTTLEGDVNKLLQIPRIPEPLDDEIQASGAVSLLPPIQFDHLGNYPVEGSHNIGCSSQSAHNNSHNDWDHELTCPCSPPGSPCEELCIVSDYEDHTPKIEIIDPSESLCHSSSRCCSEENNHVLNSPLPSKGSRPISPYQRLCNSDLTLRDRTPVHSIVDLPKRQAGPGWLAHGKDCETWVEETLRASRDLNFSRPRKVQSRRTTVVGDVPRLWINVKEGPAEKESLHYATVVTPTKPRVVTIARRNSSAGNSATTPSPCRGPSLVSAFDFDTGTPPDGLSQTHERQNCSQDDTTRMVLEKGTLTSAHVARPVATVSCHNSSTISAHTLSSSTREVRSFTTPLPRTPPQTPHRGRRRSRSNKAPIEVIMTDSDKAGTVAAQEKHPITPPQSPIAFSLRKLHSRSSFPRRMQSCSMPRRPVRLATSASYPSHFVSDFVELPWILNELETSITAFPCAMLQLESPVVQHFCLYGGSSVSCKAETAQVFRRSSLISPPHSRCSPFQPPLMSSEHHGRRQTKDWPTSPTQNPLHAIFPGAPGPLVGALHATIIALNHISEITTSFPSAPPTSRLTKIRRSPAVYHVSRSPRRFRGPLDLSSIAPKARRMLGIARLSRNPLSITHRSSQVQICESGNEPEQLRPTKQGLGERVERVRAGLTDMVGRLVEDIGKRMREDSSDGRAGTLVMALGEVVRLGDKLAG